jgi:hypothetical protein
MNVSKKNFQKERTLIGFSQQVCEENRPPNIFFKSIFSKDNNTKVFQESKD